jgi:hypothetical protein
MRAVGINEPSSNTHVTMSISGQRERKHPLRRRQRLGVPFARVVPLHSLRMIILLIFVPDKNFRDMILNTNKRRAGSVPATMDDTMMIAGIFDGCKVEVLLLTRHGLEITSSRNKND